MKKLTALVLMGWLIANCSTSSGQGPQLVVDGDGTGPDGSGDAQGDGLPDALPDQDADAPDVVPDPGADPDVSPDPGPDLLPDVAACKDPSDCEAWLGPAPDCHEWLCADGTCQDGVAAEGSPCTLPDPCDFEPACTEGTCVPQVVLDCNDGDPCTSDLCDPVEGCEHEPAPGTPCDDGDLCTTGETCDADGACAGQPLLCDDGNPCTFDSCVPETGCHAEPNTLPCDDGDPCTLDDACASGKCTGTGSLDCEDGSICTLDACEKGVGCVHDPNDGFACDDGDDCTHGDVCASGVCVGPENICDCLVVADCNAFQDNDLCNGTYGCIDGKCKPLPGSVVVCEDPAPDDCIAYQCDPADGLCHPIAVANDKPCNDQSICTTSDHCQTGQCKGTPAVCEDKNPCTADGCDPTAGCTFAPAPGAPCDDDDPCTEDDTCDANAGCSGTIKSCDDGDVCTDDTCNSNDGTCLHPLKPCADDDLCTVDGCSILLGGCTHMPVNCGDSNLCTTDGCIPATGACTHEPVTCDDGNQCTTDACDIQTGCVFVDVSQELCDDGSVCTTDSCNPASGACSHSPVSCDDFDPCTTDSCNTKTGCYHKGPCDETTKCEIWTYDPLTCECVLKQGCDDLDPCTVDSCNPATGQCAHSPKPCDDGNKCTADACVPATGACTHEPEVCNDYNACTSDSCDPATGECKFIPKDSNDGNACTKDVCNPATGEDTHEPISCDDNNPCTVDTCNPATGCAYIPQNCNDLNGCTLDSCDPAAGGCVFKPKPCDDASVCTTDACDPKTGDCVYTPVDCKDDNVCTQDTCDPKLGCQHPPAAGNCDDGEVCTLNDQCAGGKCAGAPDACDDGNACTKDSCIPAAGCDHAPLTGDPCEDGNKCTVGDKCNAGTCAAGKDQCAACFGKPPGTACDDGNAATVGDLCIAETCRGFTPASYEPNVTNAGTSLTDVDWSSGTFFISGYHEGTGVASGATWIVTPTAGSITTYYAESERTDTRYVVLSDDLAVGVGQAGGILASQLSGGKWQKAALLEKTLADLSPHYGTVGDLWGAQLKTPAVAGKEEDLYLLAGRTLGNTSILIRACTRTLSGNTESWTCPETALKQYPALELPAALFGFTAPENAGNCPDPATCNKKLDVAYLLADGMDWSYNKTPYLDWFEAHDTVQWLWNASSPVDQADKTNWSDVKGAAAGNAWAVGTGQLIVHFVNQIPAQVALPSSGSATVSYSAVLTESSFVLACGERTSNQQVNGQPGKKIELFCQFHPLANGVDDDESWTLVPLYSVAAVCNPTCPAGFTTGNRIAAAVSHAGQAYVVGSAWDANGKRKGWLSYLQF